MHDSTARPKSNVFRLALLGLGVSILTLLPQARFAAGSELRKSAIVKAVQNVRASVVNIRGEKTLSATAAQASGTEANRHVNGMGTGVAIDPRGYIITNHHVVDGVKEIQVTTFDGERYTARLIARDTETDLAIIKIDAAKEVPAIPLGSSADLMPGEEVIAVGNAFGYEHTVTRGIISALHRSVQVSDAQFYEDLIQTDASINPGNSGGPLLNIDGEMIGINVAVRAGAQGIGFAIPVDKAMAVAANLLGNRSGNRFWHGVTLAPEKSSDPTDGVTVASVEPKSPAAEAGLKPGDAIAKIGGKEIRSRLDFQRAVLERKPGDVLELEVERSKEKIEAELKLAELPERLKSPQQPAWELLGLELRAIPAEEFKAKNQTRYRGGLSLVAVRPNSPAANQGLKVGDVLVGMHIWETISMENISYILKRPDFASLSPVKFFILRGEETLYGYLPLPTLRTAQR
ncbi:MAG: trypsin-like peptidase domain-containing protein [Pirellulales bacterium]|nr:trypsin-like peptidase domain-containing protein [Pirellulales bacterium]